MELFHHFQTELKNTLAFAQVWPTLLQRSFHEPHIMCTMLCLAANHLSLLRPDNPRYSHAALQLLSQSARLFRVTLAQPVTVENCEALTGTAILMQYLVWCNVGFLEDLEPTGSDAGLDMSRDQLWRMSGHGRRALYGNMGRPTVPRHFAK
ncbi:hypothetical protein VTK73DRAFT_7065 [Phialemonium thermophilum]|uniref:Transcription factor domain-containing protein n=1 Tax=Phialemonium thermophilum TaxID=223376 RepID=A0ABR3WGW6_9PEZI